MIDSNTNSNGDLSKITASHQSRKAIVYMRQSTTGQLKHNTESTRRQYALVQRAQDLGWPSEQIQVIDRDMGLSGSGNVARSGFSELTEDVALGRVGIILGLEVSRLARNNVDWHQLIDLAGMTNTLIADADGLYHPALFNDRLLLGLKGAMSEAELHMLRSRLNGGRINKASRGELRVKLPVGYVWGENPGEIHFHPDESVVLAIRTVFKKFAELGSVQSVLTWFLNENLPFPYSTRQGNGIIWKKPQYSKIYGIMSSPIYAGAYAYGRTRAVKQLSSTGNRQNRIQRLRDPEDWKVFIPNHHVEYVAWKAYEANRKRMQQNVNPNFTYAIPDQAGAVREGRALLQGLIICGHCGRRLRVRYYSRNSIPQYYCSGENPLSKASSRCLSIGGCQIDDLVAKAFHEMMQPVHLKATLATAEKVEADREVILAHWKSSVERALFKTSQAERRYQAVDPDNRLVARTLEQQWEDSLKVLSATRIELATREKEHPHKLTPEERSHILNIGSDLATIWHAKTTTRSDQKKLLRTLIDDITITFDKSENKAHLLLRWKGGKISPITHTLFRRHVKRTATDEKTVNLVRRLAKEYPDQRIASILNLQGRCPSRAESFNAVRVKGLRRRYGIPSTPRKNRNVVPTNGSDEARSLQQASDVLNIAPTTLLRHVQDGLIEATQITPAAPWHINLTPELKAQFTSKPPQNYISMFAAMKRLKRFAFNLRHILQPEGSSSILAV